MGKVRNIYRAYTAADIFGRSSSTADKAQQATSVDYTNVSTTKIKNVLGVGSNVLSQLSTSNNVNKWSAFSPYIRTLTGSGMNAVIVHSKPSSTYEEGNDFAGYNHNATAPYYISAINDTNSSAGGNVIIECQFNLGELVITNGDIQGTDIKGIVFTVWDGGTLMGYHLRSLASIKDDCSNATGHAFIVNFQGPVTGTKTYQCKLYFNNSDTVYSYNTSEICRVFSELPQFNKTFYVPAASYVYFSAPPGWVIAGTPLSVTWSNGYMQFQGLHRPGWSGNVVVRGHIENDQTGELLTDYTTFYSGAYSGDYGIIGNAMIWKLGGVAKALPIPPYGCKACLYVV